MKAAIAAAVAGAAIGVGAAYAESKKPQPRPMTEAEMEQVFAGGVFPDGALVVGKDREIRGEGVIVLVPGAAQNSPNFVSKIPVKTKQDHPGRADVTLPRPVK